MLTRLAASARKEEVRAYNVGVSLGENWKSNARHRCVEDEQTQSSFHPSLVQSYGVVHSAES